RVLGAALPPDRRARRRRFGRSPPGHSRRAAGDASEPRSPLTVRRMKRLHHGDTETRRSARREAGSNLLLLHAILCALFSVSPCLRGEAFLNTPDARPVLLLYPIESAVKGTPPALTGVLTQRVAQALREAGRLQVVIFRDSEPLLRRAVTDQTELGNREA